MAGFRHRAWGKEHLCCLESSGPIVSTSNLFPWSPEKQDHSLLLNPNPKEGAS